MCYVRCMSRTPIPLRPDPTAVREANMTTLTQLGQFGGPRARGAWCQVACRGEGRPRFATFPVIPAPGVGQFDRRIDCLNLRSIFGADALNTQDVDPLHGRLPEPLTWNKRIIVHRRQICEFSPYHHPVPSC